jgi:hypothetical protein
MKRLDELRRRFQVLPHPPEGLCLTVPKRQWQEEWEKEFQEEGYTVLHSGTGADAVVLVKLEEMEEISTPEPSTRKQRKNRVEWDPKDEERLVKRWNEVKGTNRQRSEQLVLEFPGRKPWGIYQKYWSLTSEQAVKSGRRKKPQPERPTETKETVEPVGETKPKETVEPVGETKPKGVRILRPELREEIEKLTEVVGKLVDIVDILGCDVMMHELELREIRDMDSAFKIPLKIREAYLIARLTNDTKSRLAFRDRVQKFLDAST